MEPSNKKVLENVTNCPLASSELTDNRGNVQPQALLLQTDSMANQSVVEEVKGQPQASTMPKNPMVNRPVTVEVNSSQVGDQPRPSAQPNKQVKNQAAAAAGAAASRQGRNPWKVQPPMNTASASTSDNQAIVLERSSSAFPTIREGIESISLSSASKTDYARSNSVQSSRRKRIVYSVIPDSASLLPIRRPDNGGTVGKPIEIYTNHFAVRIDDAIINHYDVNIYMVIRGQKLIEARKDNRWEVLQKIMKVDPKFPLVWYDEGKNLYTRELLSNYDKPIEVTLEVDGEQKNFQFHIKNLVRQEKISTIFDFIEKKTLIRPRDAIRVIETLFKQRARNEQISIRNQYYDRKQTPDDLGELRLKLRSETNKFHRAHFHFVEYRFSNKYQITT